MRKELEGFVGQEVGVEFVVEKKGRRVGGEVRCIKFVKVLVVRDHKLVQVAELDHVWLQDVDEVLSKAKEGEVFRAVAVVTSYSKRGGVRDFSVQKFRSLRKL